MLNIDLLEGLICSSDLFLNSDMVVHERSETSRGSVIFYREGGLLKIGGIRYFSLDQKRGSFQIKKGASLTLKKYFVKHFRLQRKGLSDVTRG